MYYQQSTRQEIAAIANATCYDDLSEIALAQLQRMHAEWNERRLFNRTISPIGIVCGPISNGGIGKGDRVVNLRVFGVAVTHFQQERQGLFFSQMPYEDKIDELKRPELVSLGKSMANQNLLNAFYKPLFESRMIGEMCFLPGWETSDGSKWERQQGERLGITIHDIPEDIAQAFLAAA